MATLISRSRIYFSTGWLVGWWPGGLIHQPHRPSPRVTGHIYNTIVTAHALIIIFFIVIPTLMGGFGNYFVPLQIGAPDIVFPRTNMLSLSLLPIGELFLICGIAPGGCAGTSWTYYLPSGSEGHYGVSSLVASFNFMTTILKAKGPITIEGLLLFCWTQVVTSFLLVLSLPVLGCGLTILLFDRNVNSSFFDVSGRGCSFILVLVLVLWSPWGLHFNPSRIRYCKSCYSNRFWEG